MPLLKPSSIRDNIAFRIKINKGLLASIENYMQWAQIEKIDEFFEQTTRVIFDADQEWKKYQKQKTLQL